MSEHTPGPWKANHDDYHDTWSVEGDNDTICDLYYLDEETHTRHPYREGEGQTEANARLIELAPEFKAICEQVVALCEDTFYDTDSMSDEWKRVLADAKAALAQAKGMQ